MPSRTRVSVKEKPKEKPRAEPTVPKDPSEEVVEEVHGLVKVRLSSGKAIYILTYAVGHVTSTSKQ